MYRVEDQLGMMTEGSGRRRAMYPLPNIEERLNWREEREHMPEGRHGSEDGPDLYSRGLTRWRVHWSRYRSSIRISLARTHSTDRVYEL